MAGVGVSIDRSVDDNVARQIMTLVMGGTGANKARSGDAVGENTDGMSAKVFMTAKQPRTDMERVTCLSYYLTHERKVAEFKTQELTDLNREAAQPKLSNPSATARNAVTNGYLSLAGGGKKQITARGEALVSALPNRDKIQGALDEHPIRKARKRKQSQKTK